jgi:hypothetical protein
MGNNDNVTSQSRRFDLTVEELRKVPGYEDVSEEEAFKTLESIKEFCLLFYEYANSKNIFS